MNKVKKIKEMRYWMNIEGPGNLSWLNKDIPKSLWERPNEMFYIPIHQVTGGDIYGENVPIGETLTKKLVYRLYDRMETGIRYKFVGYE